MVVETDVNALGWRVNLTPCCSWISQDVDAAYMTKVEKQAKADSVAEEINSLRVIFEAVSGQILPFSLFLLFTPFIFSSAKCWEPL